MYASALDVTLKTLRLEVAADAFDPLSIQSIRCIQTARLGPVTSCHNSFIRLLLLVPSAFRLKTNQINAYSVRTVEEKVRLGSGPSLAICVARRAIVDAIKFVSEALCSLAKYKTVATLPCFQTLKASSDHCIACVYGLSQMYACPIISSR